MNSDIVTSFFADTFRTRSFNFVGIQMIVCAKPDLSAQADFCANVWALRFSFESESESESDDGFDFAAFEDFGLPLSFDDLADDAAAFFDGFDGFDFVFDFEATAAAFFVATFFFFVGLAAASDAGVAGAAVVVAATSFVSDMHVSPLRVLPVMRIDS